MDFSEQNFLNLETNITTRNYMWKTVHQYIKDNNLLTPEDKRYFDLDGEAGDTLIQALMLDKTKKNSIYSIRKDIENNIIKT